MRKRNPNKYTVDLYLEDAKFIDEKFRRTDRGNVSYADGVNFMIKYLKKLEEEKVI